MALTNAFFGKDVMLSSTVTSSGGITCCCCCCCSKVVSCSCSYSCSCSSRLFSFVLVVIDDSPPPVPEFFCSSVSTTSGSSQSPMDCPVFAVPISSSSSIVVIIYFFFRFTIPHGVKIMLLFSPISSLSNQSFSSVTIIIIIIIIIIVVNGQFGCRILFGYRIIMFIIIIVIVNSLGHPTCLPASSVCDTNSVPPRSEAGQAERESETPITHTAVTREREREREREWLVCFSTNSRHTVWLRHRRQSLSSHTSDAEAWCCPTG
mmetsp:Transcript_17476/g.17599  ORF Transcript_17476/g.17599 Transcript_17476/m.17599 type:complete len:263 (-) Transcript_17476:4-792(-)